MVKWANALKKIRESFMMLRTEFAVKSKISPFIDAFHTTWLPHLKRAMAVSITAAVKCTHKKGCYIYYNFFECKLAG